jgi:hypothetical protein
MNYLKAIQLPKKEQACNFEVQKAYYKIAEEINSLFKTLSNPHFRVRVEINHKENPQAKQEVHEVLTPFIFLILNADEKGNYTIRYALNSSATYHLGQAMFNQLLRIIYKNTMLCNTRENIEDRLEYIPYYPDAFEEAISITENEGYNYYHLIVEELIE